MDNGPQMKNAKNAFFYPFVVRGAHGNAYVTNFIKALMITALCIKEKELTNI